MRNRSLPKWQKRSPAECFHTYEREISLRMEQDIQSRKAELDNLVEQRQVIEIDRGVKITRLQQLEAEIISATI